MVLDSTEPSKQWKINPQGQTDIQYALISNSINIRGPPIVTLHCDSLGNLTNWDVDPYWVGAGADNNWSTAANWDTGTVPINTSIITFDGTAHGVPGAIPNKDSTIDAAFQGTVASLTVNGYSGTITLERSLTVTSNITLKTAHLIAINGNITLNSLNGGMDIDSTFEASQGSIYLNAPNGFVKMKGSY